MYKKCCPKGFMVANLHRNISRIQAGSNDMTATYHWTLSQPNNHITLWIIITSKEVKSVVYIIIWSGWVNAWQIDIFSLLRTFIVAKFWACLIGNSSGGFLMCFFEWIHNKFLPYIKIKNSGYREIFLQIKNQAIVCTDVWIGLFLPWRKELQQDHSLLCGQLWKRSSPQALAGNISPKVQIWPISDTIGYILRHNRWVLQSTVCCRQQENFRHRLLCWHKT